MNKLTALAAVPALSAALFLASNAEARTVPAVAGTTASSGASNCFVDTIPAGIRNTCAAAAVWDVAVVYDTPTLPEKHIIVRGTGAVQCTYLGTSAFAVNGAAIPLPLNAWVTIPVVPAGSYGRVRCTIGANQSGSLLGIEYYNP